MRYWWIILVIVAALFLGFSLYFRLQFYPAQTSVIPVQSKNIELQVIKEKTVNGYVIKHEEKIIFIDTGYGVKLPREMQKLSIRPEQVTHIFLTHSDYDHVGGLKFFDKAEIYLGKPEELLLTGENKRFFKILTNDPLKRDYNLMDDGEIIKIGDIQIKAIHTPGHTTGHTCFLLNKQYVFTGDLLRIKKNRIKPFFPFINMNTKMVRESITKLVDQMRVLPLELICTGHTGYSNNVQNLLQSWLL